MRVGNHYLRKLGLALLATASLLTIEAATDTAAAATVTANLCAGIGSLTMPDSVSIPVWGYGLDPSGSGPCAATVPGPVITAAVGDTVNVTLRNTLGTNVSAIFNGQPVAPDNAGTATTATYSFIAAGPGTFLYESGVDPQTQIPMGLYGALVVRPVGQPMQMYDAASTFNTESVLVLSEIDPNLNLNPATFNLLNYHPTYWLINGRAYPQTAPLAISNGETGAVRYLNAGSINHTMTLLGLRQKIVGVDGTKLTTPIDTVSHTIAAGQTADVLIQNPVGTTPGKRFPLYNRQLRLTNGSSPAQGGMQTFVQDMTPTTIYFSTTNIVPVPGVLGSPDDADIYKWDGATNTYSRVLDLSTLGAAGAADVDELAVLTDGLGNKKFFMSFTTDARTVTGLGILDDSDIVIYDQAAGTWSLFFDGSDVGLSATTEDVDGFEIIADISGNVSAVLISTNGNTTVPGLTARQDEDVLRCNLTSTETGGATPGTTVCTWSDYFDGTDIYLTQGSENVDGIAVIDRGATQDLLFSTVGAFAVPLPAVLSGVGADIATCVNAQTAGVSSSVVNSACVGGYRMHFDGSVYFLFDNVDAFEVE